MSGAAETESIAHLPKIANLHVQLLHTSRDFLARRMLAVHKELVRLGPSLKKTLDDEVRLALSTLEFDLDVTLFCANLRAQLAESPDTRWHAAHLFTRYFLRMGQSPSSSPVAATKKAKVSAGADEDIMDGREALAWDFAVACLASAVKVGSGCMRSLTLF